MKDVLCSLPFHGRRSGRTNSAIILFYFFYLENKEKTGRMKIRPCGLMRPTSQPWNRAAHCFIISQIYTLSNITNKQQHTTTHNIQAPLTHIQTQHTGIDKFMISLISYLWIILVTISNLMTYGK